MRAIDLALSALALGGLYVVWRVNGPAPRPGPRPSTSAVSSANVIEKYVNPAMRLASGKRFTVAPLWDVDRNTWARQNYSDAQVTLARLGLRMPDAEELDEIARRKDAYILKPVTLVNSAADSAKMATEEFWQRHDRGVAAQIEQLGWEPSKGPLVSVGKHWYRGAPTGRAYLHGWYVPRGEQPGGGFSRVIQNRGTTAHNDRHIDYSSTIIGVES